MARTATQVDIPTGDRPAAGEGDFPNAYAANKYVMFVRPIAAGKI